MVEEEEEGRREKVVTILDKYEALITKSHLDSMRARKKGEGREKDNKT